MSTTSYVCGLDLGQAQDYSAFAVLERTLLPDGKQHHAVVYLHRYPLGTPYTSPDPLRPGVGQQLKAMLTSPGSPLAGCIIAVDQTGVGRAVVDVLAGLGLPAHLVPVTITGGQQASQQEDQSWHTPKKDLVGVLQVLLNSQRLEIRSELKLASVLVREFDEFRSRITQAANEQFGVWREGAHDDLVLSVALACWLGERMPAFTRASIGRGPRRAITRIPGGESIGADFRHLPRGL